MFFKGSSQSFFLSLLAAMVASLSIGVLSSSAEMVESPHRGPSQDSHAPPGAPAHWLPHDQWVSQHWLPFDEGRFHKLLKIDRGRVYSLLKNDHHNFVALAKKQGFTVNQLATKLLAPRREEVGPRKYRVLRQRAKDMITQGHLAQHVFFHSLHESRIPAHAKEIFGVNTPEFRSMRRKAFSPFQIGLMHGRTQEQMTKDTFALLKASAREGVRNKAMTAKQADLLLKRQLPKERWWLRAAILPHFYREP